MTFLISLLIRQKLISNGLPISALRLHLLRQLQRGRLREQHRQPDYGGHHDPLACVRVRDAGERPSAVLLQLAGSDAGADLPVPVLYARPQPVDICFSVWSQVLTWYILQSLIYHIYFTTLVYYFAKKYLQKRIPFQHRKPYIITLIVLYVLFCLAELGIFIYMVNLGLHHCKQVAEMAVNAVMIALGILFFALAYQNETEQKKKFEQYKASTIVKNPLSNIWIWVCLNIIGQIISEVESVLIYNYYGGNECYPIQSNIETDILSPIFLALTYGLSFCSTLWFYNQKRKQQQQSQSISFSQLQMAQSDLQNRVQLLPYSSSNLSEDLNKHPI